MTTQARIGHGNLLQIFDLTASPDAWVTLGEVESITPPSYARDAQDATHTESTEGWREFIPGLKDGGEISATLNLVPDSDTLQRLQATFDSGELQQLRILFADGGAGAQTSSPITCSRFTANCIVTGLALEAPIDNKMMATLTAKLTGKPAFVRATT
jgi:predicted secreted protein